MPSISCAPALSPLAALAAVAGPIWRRPADPTAAVPTPPSTPSLPPSPRHERGAGGRGEDLRDPPLERRRPARRAPRGHPRRVRRAGDRSAIERAQGDAGGYRG